MAEVSPTTQAILLLVAPLQAGGSTEANLLLNPSEYTRLAKVLRRLDRQPCELLGKEAPGLLKTLERDFDRNRLQRLLGRGMQLALALEHWHQSSIQVISRADADYPQGLKQSLGYRSPSLLYVCGNADLLQQGGLAVVGSRKVDPEILEYAGNIGEMAAAAGCTIVSGGAKGVDQANMQGAASAGGKVIGVMPNNLERAVLHRDNRNGLLNQELLLCSPFDPAAGFQAWRAMERNKLIYALSNVALVVQSDVGKGGTWSGAREQIQKLHCVPIYTRTAGPLSRGLEALRDLGAHSWPEPKDADEFRNVMESAILADRTGAAPVGTPLLQEVHAPRPADPVPAESEQSPWAAELAAKVEKLLLRVLEQEALSAKSVATLLDVRQHQATAWLGKLVAAGDLQKTSRPVQYRRTSTVPATGAGRSKLDPGAGNSGLMVQDAPSPPRTEVQDREIPAGIPDSTSEWAAELMVEVEDLLTRLLELDSLSSTAAAGLLEVGSGQAKSWLDRLVEAGKIERTSKPLRYHLNSSSKEAKRAADTEVAKADRPRSSSQSGPRQQVTRRRASDELSSKESDRSLLAVELLTKVEELLLRLLKHEALSAQCIAETLKANPTQVNSWLGQLVEAGKLVKTYRPVRYQWNSTERQNSLL